MWKYRSPHDARPAAAADQIAALIANGRADLGILAVTRVASDRQQPHVPRIHNNFADSLDHGRTETEPQGLKTSLT